MDRLLPALALLVVAGALAVVMQRRRPDAPVRPTGEIPAQLDRGDFDRPEAPWLVVLFSSASCDVCAEVRPRVRALESDAVAVQEAEYRERRDLHDRYGIDTVPMVVIADAEGVVRRGHTGPIAAVELWAMVAEIRDEPRPPAAESD